MESVFVDEETIQGIADADTACLGVVDDCFAHFQVTVLVKIGIHHASPRLDDRDAGSVAHEVDKFAAATWDAEVHIAHSIQHLARSLVGCRQQGDNIGVDAIFLQYFVNQCHLFPVTLIGIFATFQNTGVAALEAEREDIERDVGACFIDHADNPERY